MSMSEKPSVSGPAFQARVSSCVLGFGFAGVRESSVLDLRFYFGTDFLFTTGVFGAAKNNKKRKRKGNGKAVQVLSI